MTTDKESHDRVTRWIRRIARIWSAPIIVYALLMFCGYTWNWVTTGVADPYVVEDFPLIEALPPIFIFLSVLGLGIAWRWERVGGTLALAFQLIAVLLLLVQTPITEDLPRSAVPYLISMVVVVPSVLFLVSWRRSRRRVIA